MGFLRGLGWGLPTIGAYDKLAIQYGYTHSTSTNAEAAPILEDGRNRVEYCGLWSAL